MFFDPLLTGIALIVIALPMIVGKVPRNRYYGFRTRSALASEQSWLRANAQAGIVMVVSGASMSLLAIAGLIMRTSMSEMRAQVGYIFLWCYALPFAFMAIAFWRINVGLKYNGSPK